MSECKHEKIQTVFKCDGKYYCPDCDEWVIVEKKEPDWILVEKEFPPLRVKIWAWDGEEVEEFKLRFLKADDIYLKKYLADLKITHWMPYYKPQPPKKEEPNEKPI